MFSTVFFGSGCFPLDTLVTPGGRSRGKQRALFANIKF